MSFIGDTLKDDSGAWDTVRIIAGPACLASTAIILIHMALDPLLYDHILQYVGGLAGTWTAYAAAVVGHAMAKK